MSLASWLTATHLRRPSAMNKSDRRSRRQPIHSRPSLEHLEERTLLDASSGLIGGSFNNPNLNSNFNFASNGNVLPTPGFTSFGASSVANGANPAHSLNFAGLASSEVGAEAASSTFLAQDQLYGQFRIFGVNSQGDSPRLGWETTGFFLRDAYGFGSGGQPNAPWKPNAYNLGLANGQFSYSTQNDMGFSSVPPWVRRGFNQAARPLPRNQDHARNPDQTPPLDQEKESAEAPEQSMPKRPLHEQEQAPQDRMDKDREDPNEDLKGMMDQPASEKQSPIEAVTQEDGSLPDSLWLSALAPVPMTALVAGLPGMAAALEGGGVGGDAGAEAGE